MDDGGDDHYTTDKGIYVGTAVWLLAKVRDRRLGLRLRLFVGSVCDDSAAEAAYAAIVAHNLTNVH